MLDFGGKREESGEPQRGAPLPPLDSAQLRPPRGSLPALPFEGLRRLFLDMNAYYASVEQSDTPRYRGKPLIVVNSPGENTTAIAVSYEAKALGISRSMSVRDARIRCPDLLVIQARAERYKEVHRNIVQIVRDEIGEVQVLSIDEMACPLPRALSSEEGARDVALGIKAAFRRHLGEHLRCSIGIAPNVFLAKVAAEKQKPDGLVIFGENYGERLVTLRLTDLPGIERATEEKLHNAGIGSVEALLRASPGSLRLAWGSVKGEEFYFKLRGSLIADYPDNRSPSRKSVSKAHRLPPSHRTMKGAREVLMSLVRDALHELRQDKLTAQHLDLSIQFYDRQDGEPAPSLTAAVQDMFPSNDDNLWAPLATRALEDMTIGFSHGVPNAVQVRFTQLNPESIQPESLFDTTHLRRHRIREVIKAAESKFGPGSLVYGAFFELSYRRNEKIGFGPPREPRAK